MYQCTRQITGYFLFCCLFLAFTMTDARSQEVTHSFEFFYDKNEMGDSDIRVGVIDIKTSKESFLSKKEDGSNFSFLGEFQHEKSEYYMEIFFFIDVIKLDKKFRISPFLESKGPARTIIPVRVRRHTETVIGFKLSLPTSFGLSTKEKMDEFRSADKSERQKILSKYVTGSLGYDLISSEIANKRRWARIRFDGILQLAKSEVDTDLIQIPSSVRDAFGAVISDRDRVSVNGNYTWHAANFIRVDSAYIRGNSDIECEEVIEIVDAMSEKNENSQGVHLESLKLGKNYFGELLSESGC